MKEVFQCPFKSLSKREWIIYAVSLAIVIVSNVLVKDIDWLKMITTIVGATALIFIAKGNVWGQMLSVLFCLLYACISYLYKYYGEMITYLAMSFPISLVSVFTWIKNPYKKGENVVKICKLSLKEVAFMMCVAIIISAGFYFVLKELNTPNLIVSTVSIATSFCATYLMMRRNSYYALSYAINDLVLILLWSFATLEDVAYLNVVACFVMFFINDLYGFISWKSREREQCDKK